MRSELESALRHDFLIERVGPVMIASVNWRRKKQFSAGELKTSGGKISLFKVLTCQTRKLLHEGRLLAADAYSEPPTIDCAIVVVIGGENDEQTAVTLVMSPEDRNKWLRFLNAAVYVERICTTALDTTTLAITGTIGKGSFGQVFSGALAGQEVAVKVVLGGYSDPEQQVELASEAGVLQSIQMHPNILEFVGIARFTDESAPPLFKQYIDPEVIAEQGVIGMVTELCPFGTLADMLHVRSHSGRVIEKAPDLGLKKACEIACGIAEGLRFVHGLGVVHRDLKPENIMIGAGHVPKLVDFGQSRKVALNREMTADTRGSLLWRAPEIMSGANGQEISKTVYYGVEADIYSFGVIFWEIITREMPYTHVKNTWDIIRGVQTGTLRPSCSDEWPPHLKFLITWCWETKASNRPLAEQVTQIIRNQDFLSMNPSKGLQRDDLTATIVRARSTSQMFAGIDGRAHVKRGKDLLEDLPALVTCLHRPASKGGLELTTRRWLGWSFPDVFVGKQLCTWLMNHCGCDSNEANKIGELLQSKGFISHSITGTTFSVNCFWYWMPESIFQRLLLLLEDERLNLSKRPSASKLDPLSSELAEVNL